MTSVFAVAGVLFGADMMEDEARIGFFVVTIAALAVAAVTLLPWVMKGLTIRWAVPALAVVGPVLAVLGSLVGSGAMTLSGHDIGYFLLVIGVTGLAAIFVGWRLSRPLAKDLDTVLVTVDAIAGGDRSRRTGIDRGDEVGALAGAVDELGRSLARAEAEREAADDERRAVVSALSHDLRTPLASLLASVDALEDGLADGTTHLRSMRRNVLALERLVDDMFLLARADSGQLSLQAEHLDLAELIDEALEAVAPAAGERDVKLTAEMSGAISIWGDDTAVGRVLRNLLDNAIRHASSGGLVEVSTVVANRAVTMTVVDDGPGFDAQFVPRAFERFTQADAARSRPGGAGLGLAIAQTLVEAHDGEISIDPGPGGRVSVRLPLFSPPSASNGRVASGSVDTGSEPPGITEASRLTASSNRSGSPSE